MIYLRDWKIGCVISALRPLYGNPYSAPYFPHITLYGMFTLMPGIPEETIRAAIEAAGQNLDSIRVSLEDWIVLPGRRGKAIAYGAVPSPGILSFYQDLSKRLEKVVSTRSWIDDDPRHPEIPYHDRIRTPSCPGRQDPFRSPGQVGV